MKDNNYKKSHKNFKKAPRGGESTPVAVNDKFAHTEAVQAVPLEVKVYNNNFDKALRAFRALVQKERILSTYKEKQSYEKASDKRRRKRNEMKRKRKEIYVSDKREGSKKSFKHRKSPSDASSE
jgi:small subunit ribosomal protein S21